MRLGIYSCISACVHNRRQAGKQCVFAGRQQPGSWPIPQTGGGGSSWLMSPPGRDRRRDGGGKEGRRRRRRRRRRGEGCLGRFLAPFQSRHTRYIPWWKTMFFSPVKVSHNLLTRRCEKGFGSWMHHSPWAPPPGRPGFACAAKVTLRGNILEDGFMVVTAEWSATKNTHREAS